MTSRNSTDPTMTTYLRAIARHPLLDREEERALCMEYARTGDPKLAQRLAVANLRLVVKMARGYARRGANILDLIQEGNLGLMEGIRRFDPTREVRLASYAGWWIRAYMLQHLLATARLVRAGRSREDRAAFMRGEPPPSELGLAEAFPEEEVASGALDPDDESAFARPDRVVERRQALERLRDRLRALTPKLDKRDRTILTDRLLAEEPVRLRDIGHRLAVSGEAIRQAESRLLSRLRADVGLPAAA